MSRGGDAGLDESSKEKSSARNSMVGWLFDGKKQQKPVEVSVPAKILVVIGFVFHLSIKLYLILLRTYSIGKERIVKAVAYALNTKIYCESRKRALFACQQDQELQDLLGDDALECDVHVLPLQNITSDKLLEYLEMWKGKWDKVLGFRPTGWT